MRYAVLCSRVRVEEKLLFDAMDRKGIPFDRVDPRGLAVDIDSRTLAVYDAVLVRCISHTRAFYLTRWLNELGVRTVNSHEAVACCGDKLLMSLAFRRAGLPTPGTRFSFDETSMLAALDETGYPAVLKPVHGSWGRLLAKVSDRNAAEAILEHKKTLGGVPHSVFYAQEYVEKPGRDLRVLVVGGQVVYGVWRRSDHWITNTALGGQTTVCELTPEQCDLSLRAANAVGGEIVAVDLLETIDGRMLVNEVNHTPEFHGAIQVVSADIAGRMVDQLLGKGDEEG